MVLPKAKFNWCASYKFHIHSWRSQLDDKGRRVKANRNGVGCTVCCKAGMSSSLAKFEVRTAAKMQMCYFKRHAMSNAHRHANGETIDGYGTPSEKEFRTIAHLVADKGVSASKNGVDGIGRGDKVRKMIRCLAEALKRSDQKFISKASSIGLMRDAKDKTLVVRYRAVDSQLNIRTGVLGLQRMTTASAKDISLQKRSTEKKFPSIGALADTEGNTWWRTSKSRLTICALPIGAKLMLTNLRTNYGHLHRNVRYVSST